jgi:hypothetical protein
MLYLVSCFSCLWKAFYVPLSQEAKKKANILLEIAYARACQLFFMFMESFLCHIVSDNNCLAFSDVNKKLFLNSLSQTTIVPVLWLCICSYLLESFLSALLSREKDSNIQIDTYF